MDFVFQKRTQKLSAGKIIAAFFLHVCVGLEDKARAAEVPQVRITLLRG